MDIVKATVNLSERTIQLEGPQEFVEKYLELYRTVFEKLAPSPASDENIKESEDKTPKEETPARKRVVRSRTGPKCSDKITELITEGYFKEPRTRADVQQELKTKKGVIFTASEVSANLINLFNGGKILRLGEDKTFKYYCNV